MIRLVAIANPFQPILSRTVYELSHVDGTMLADVLRDAEIDPNRHTCIIDGYAVPPEILAGYPVRDGVEIIAIPTVAGHGWEKMTAELAVMAAVVVVTGGLAAGPMAGLGAGAMGSMFASIGLGGLSSATVGLIGAGIALGGNMLVNAFLGNVGGSGNNSASWDPTGPKTVASGSTPIPKGYGTVMSGGNIIASYPTAEGEDNYLNVEVSHGWGPARSLADLRINKNSIQNFIGVTYQVRYGSNAQTPIPYFSNIVNGYPQATRCIAVGAGGSPVVINGTGTATQGLEVVIQFPDGVFYSTNNGNTIPLRVAYLIEYSVHGSGTWQQPYIPDATQDIITRDIHGVITYAPTWVVIPSNTHYSSGVVYQWDSGSHTPGDIWTGTQTLTIVRPDGSTFTTSVALAGEWQPCDTNLNQQGVMSWRQGYVIFSGANQGALYHQTAIYNLTPAQYDVRVTKYGSAISPDAIQQVEGNNNRTGDQVWVHSINEIQYQDLAYPNMILAGVRALATDQLSGASINLTALVTFGINATLPAALAGFGEDNPAVVAYDMLVNPLYGGNVSAANIDVPAFAEWAAYCDQTVSDGFGGTIKRSVFNGIFDQPGTNLWKALQKVAILGYASMVQIGQYYTVNIDQLVTVPAQVFTVGNVIRDSIKDTWIALDDRANRIEVTFADAARDYRTDEPCAVMLAANINTGAEIKPTRVQLLGCTNRAQAWHWAYRKLMSTSLCLLQRSFDVGIEAVACQVGSVIGIQDDVTQWAYGGRIQAGSTASSLIVDRDDLPWASGVGWTATVVHPVVQRGTGTVSSITGNVVTFAAPIPTARVVNFTGPTGTNYIIEGVGTSTATVQSVTGLSGGQAVTFYDQDVVDTQPISARVGGVLTPYAPFLQAPSADSPWVYGQSAGAFPAQLFTVTNIRRKGDLQMTIDTLVYEPAIYSDDTPLITQTLSVPDANAAVTSLTAVENYTMANSANGGQASVINVGWQNGPNTARTELWIAQSMPAIPQSPERLYETVSKGTSAQLSFATGTILQIRAVGVDAQGNPAPFATAPVVTITVQGSGSAPGDVPLFAGAFVSSVTVLTWGAATSAANYEVRYNSDPANTNWNTAGLLWSGSALTWADAQVRLGCYLIKSISSTTVECVSAASWNYLQNPVRVNTIGLMPGQGPFVALTTNTYDSGTSLSTLVFTVVPQSPLLTDGTPVALPASSVSWTGTLAPTTVYYIYLYLQPGTFLLAASTGGSPTPDTAASTPDLNFCSANGNYLAFTAAITTAGPVSGGSSTGAAFDVTTTMVTDFFGDPAYEDIDITVITGGTGYTSGTASLTGTVAPHQTSTSTRRMVSYTAVGGVVTAVSGWDSSLIWLAPPSLVI